MKFGIQSTVLALVLAIPLTLPAATIYTATLAGTNENPSNSSTGTGNITVTLTGDSLGVNESFSGLSGPATGAHIHCCTAPGTNTGIAVPFTAFPATASGTYNQTFDLTLAATYTSGFLTAEGGTAAGAEAALIAGLNAGQAYANIHTQALPGGEIRGFLGTATPEPATSGALLLGLGLMALAAKKRYTQA